MKFLVLRYIDEACTTCLLLITNNRDAFFELKNCRSKIVQNLSSNGCLGEISKAVLHNSYRIDTMEVADLRHFLYKSKSIAQVDLIPHVSTYSSLLTSSHLGAVHFAYTGGSVQSSGRARTIVPKISGSPSPNTFIRASPQDLLPQRSAGDASWLDYCRI